MTDTNDRYRPSRARRTVMLSLVAASVVVVLLAGGWAVRWFVAGADVYEDKHDAVALATDLGLRVEKKDRVVFGEVQSSFPDSSSDLVVETESITDRDRLLAASHLACGRRDPTLGKRWRPVSDHGPGTPASLMECSNPFSSKGGLAASYDPAAPDAGTRVYISAYQM